MTFRPEGRRRIPSATHPPIENLRADRSLTYSPKKNAPHLQVSRSFAKFSTVRPPNRLRQSKSVKPGQSELRSVKVGQGWNGTAILDRACRFRRRLTLDPKSHQPSSRRQEISQTIVNEWLDPKTVKFPSRLVNPLFPHHRPNCKPADYSLMFECSLNFEVWRLKFYPPHASNSCASRSSGNPTTLL